MHLINVLLPAPLSPTRAVTFPAYTSRSTSFRTCTGPKDLLTPRKDRTAVVIVSQFLHIENFYAAHLIISLPTW